MSDKIEIEKFKEEIEKLYKGFPSYHFYGIESMVKDPEIRKVLCDEHILVKLKRKYTNKGDEYMLGANGLNLVNSWNIEKLTSKMLDLTKKIESLTTMLVLFTGFLIALAILSIYLALLQSFPKVPYPSLIAISVAIGLLVMFWIVAQGVKKIGDEQQK